MVEACNDLRCVACETGTGQPEKLDVYVSEGTQAHYLDSEILLALNLDPLHTPKE